MMCKRCWSDASFLAGLRGVPVVEVYMELIVLRAVTKDLEGCNAEEVQEVAEVHSQKIGGTER